MEYFDDFKSNRDKQITVISITFFLIAFPTYFAMAGNLKGVDELSDDTEGDWIVAFDETTSAFGSVENDMINDGESKNYQWNTDAVQFDGDVGYLKMKLSYDETDESGNQGNECDTIDVTIKMGGVAGAYSDVTDSLSQCGSYEWWFQVTPGYDGYTTLYPGVTKNQIESYWNDGGNGTGMVDVTIGVRTTTGNDGIPLTPDNNEQGESVTVIFEITTYELDISPYEEVTE